VINVIASIQSKEGQVSKFIEIFKSNVPNVLREKGCVEYMPAIDVPTGLPPQALDHNVVTIIEKWDSLEDLKAHMSAPHMLAYREKAKDLVETMSVKILKEA
jgi:quinol monooxygenase YgiN